VRISVDAEKCSGNGRCLIEAPEIYALDDLGYCRIIRSGVTDPYLVAQAQRGHDGCPEGAISLSQQ
jgi:ferredoxin